VTAVSALLSWLEAPDSRRGIRFLQPDSRWRLYSYAELTHVVMSAAALLADCGVRRGDVVVVVADTGPEFVGGFFGALACGATPSPVAPPLITQQPGAYDRHLVHILTAARPRAVLTTPDLAGRVESALPDGMSCAVLPVTADELVSSGREIASVVLGETALLQFTSGSSGPPKGVLIPVRALEANIAAILHWVRLSTDDPTASWLPVHHDMGLIGCLLTPVVNGSDLWNMRPLDFVRSPATWLGCFGLSGARLTAVPNFGLAYVARKVAPEALTGMDFSGWRTVIIGAERIDPDVLDRFARMLGPHGFVSGAYQPAYGLAEATLAVTGVPLRQQPRVLTVDRRSLTPGGRVEPAPEQLRAWWPMRVVGCGYPLGAATVRIAGPDGGELGDGCFGEIVVEGPSVASGYLHHPDGSTVTTIDEGSLRTGDAGFLLDGELFVVGRLGDSIKRRARMVFAEDLEALLLELPVMRQVRPVVLLGTHEGIDTAVVVADREPGPWIGQVVRSVRLHAEDIDVAICAVSKGTVLRTSSGKPRRMPLWLSFAAGGLPRIDTTTWISQES
jgi:acyl-CoA synthetase (AMP-forming)/AMP-acid ligase II